MPLSLVFCDIEWYHVIHHHSSIIRLIRIMSHLSLWLRSLKGLFLNQVHNLQRLGFQIVVAELHSHLFQLKELLLKQC